MKLIHPDNLQIRPWDKSLEVGSPKPILTYHYLPSGPNGEKFAKEFKERHLDPKEYSSKQPHLIFEEGFLKKDKKE